MHSEAQLGYTHQQVLLDIARNEPTTIDEIAKRIPFGPVSGYVMQMLNWGYVWSEKGILKVNPAAWEMWPLNGVKKDA